MHVHFIGVAGTLMGSVAGLVRRAGHRVTGSDLRFYEPMGSALRGFGVECFEGYRPEHLEPAPDCVVIGNVCRADNPEARAAIERGLPYLHVAGAIERFALTGTRPLVVAGTHGKTTTTALAAYLLERAGRHPGYLIGGIAKNFGSSFSAAKKRLKAHASATSERTSAPTNSAETNSGAGESGLQPPFVIEGDEYDTAFFEKTPKFIHYHCQNAIVTSIEHDHIDIYPELGQYRAAFASFIRGLPAAGLLVANAADAEVAELVTRTARCRVAWYALEGDRLQVSQPVWLAAPGRTGAEGVSFDLYAGGVFSGRWLSPLMGLHNLRNALAAIVACADGYRVPLSELARFLPAFAGVKRRQELLGTAAGVVIYDDFAHHPSAVRETLAALRARHPAQRLHAVFEPRSATACRALHQNDYPAAFALADFVYLAPPGRPDIPVAEQLDRARIVNELGSLGRSAWALASADAIVDELASQARAGDVVVFLSNGDLGRVQERLARELEKS